MFETRTDGGFVKPSDPKVMGQFEIRGQLPRWSGAGLNFFHEWRHSSFGWLANLCHTRSVSDPPLETSLTFLPIFAISVLVGFIALKIYNKLKNSN